uniref:Uncharacterized protein n=1 Tax=Salvator merianae TaxID=96440 RepID=A0A8D0BPM9_SALMN
MAAAVPLEAPCEAITCPVCNEFFSNPMLLDCGHSFCNACLLQLWGYSEPETLPSCPQCGKTFQEESLRPNEQLAKLVETAGRREKEREAEEGGAVCEKHQERLQPFSEDDPTLTCQGCHSSEEHDAHDGASVEEAAQGSKVSQAEPSNNTDLETPQIASSDLTSPDVQQQATCPLCKDYLTDPLTLNCGHNVCRLCITKHRESIKKLGFFKCPFCKNKTPKKDLRQNWQLANIVEQVKALDLNTYKENIEAQLASLEKEKDILESQMRSEEQQSRGSLAQLETEKENVQFAFERLQEFLEDKKRHCLMQLSKLEDDIMERQKKNGVRLSEEISSLSNLITEMRTEMQLADSSMNLQSLKDLSRFEKKGTRHAMDLAPWVQEKIQTCSLKNSALEKTMRTFKEVLVDTLDKDSPDYVLIKAPLDKMYKGFPLLERNKVSVTLDPKTADPELIVSKDLKSVRSKESLEEYLTDDDENYFDSSDEEGDNPEPMYSDDLGQLLAGDPGEVPPSLSILPKDLEQFPPASAQKLQQEESVDPSQLLLYDFDDPEQVLSISSSRENTSCIFGQERFTSGAHWWEVEVEVDEDEDEDAEKNLFETENSEWVVGVARESVMEEMFNLHSPRNGFWAIGKESDTSKVYAFTNHRPTRLSLKSELRKIRVCLDYEGRSVIFFNAETDTLLFTFSSASFAGEPLRPYFFLYGDVVIRC